MYNTEKRGGKFLKGIMKKIVIRRKIYCIIIFILLGALNFMVYEIQMNFDFEPWIFIVCWTLFTMIIIYLYTKLFVIKKHNDKK